MPITIGIFSHSVGAFLLLLLFLFQIKIWQKKKSSLVLVLSIFLSLVWCLGLVLQASLTTGYFFVIQILELLKNSCWFLVLLNYLGLTKTKSRAKGQGIPSDVLGLAVVSLGVPFCLLLAVLILNLGGPESVIYPEFGGTLVISGFLFNAVLGLALLEQVIRNTTEHYLYHIKFLCLGLGVLYFYDLYLYSNALLFGRLDTTLWEIRGIVYVLAAPLIMVSVSRIHRLPLQVNISRKLVFHSGVLLASGVYLLLMSTAGFYIRSSAGEWGIVLQALFWLIGAGVLLIAVFSGRIRSHLKVYISRNLFSSRYDYREEWLRISRTLAYRDSEDSLPKRAIMAMADLVDSPGGALWLSTDNNHYDQIAEFEMGWAEDSGLTENDKLIDFLKQKNWIIDVTDKTHSGYPHELPPWLKNWNKAWLLIPLVLHEKLIGFIILRHSRTGINLNWEDFDILKTAAQQASSYLAQMLATEALSMVQQFTAFNQMSAFVVHDLKTLNSQLSLLVSNAENHKSNPEFIEDMITTTDHAVKKMNFLLDHFKDENHAEKYQVEQVNLVTLIHDVVEDHRQLKPFPELFCDDTLAFVSAVKQELNSAIGHLVKNAQEATEDDGSVSIALETDNEHVRVKITDTGKGMTEEYLHTQLYKPFESTKGLTGMGIGVYQSREYIRKAGGELNVKSQPGLGTEFTITLPRVFPETTI